MVIPVTVIIAILVSTAATRVVMMYARRRLVDPVNQRSSHRIATPRGGGLGLVIGLLTAWLLAGSWGDAGWVWPEVVGLAGAIVGMSVLGWWDDHANLSARLRLPLQLALVGVVLWVIGLPVQMGVAGTSVVPVMAWWFIPVATVGGGWMVNLTNFMDGIDGIAATQSIIGCIALALLLPPHALELRLLLLACAAASLGFLVWNRPPAQIFMGDVGSTAVGLVFVIAVLGGLQQGIALELLLLPFAPFIADATCTLIRRAWLREPLHHAHCSHLYQRLASVWNSHLLATLLFAGLALLGAGLALAGAARAVPPLVGVGLWGALWVGLVIYGRRRCPVGG